MGLRHHKIELRCSVVLHLVIKGSLEHVEDDGNRSFPILVKMQRVLDSISPSHHPMGTEDALVEPAAQSGFADLMIGFWQEGRTCEDASSDYETAKNGKSIA